MESLEGGNKPSWHAGLDTSFGQELWRSLKAKIRAGWGATRANLRPRIFWGRTNRTKLDLLRRLLRRAGVDGQVESHGAREMSMRILCKTGASQSRQLACHGLRVRVSTWVRQTGVWSRRRAAGRLQGEQRSKKKRRRPVAVAVQCGLLAAVSSQISPFSVVSRSLHPFRSPPRPRHFPWTPV
jgi:hypothetical protein